MREVGTEASWRKQPLHHCELLSKIIASQGTINPLLFAPWVHSRIFRKDWLHCVDQGVAADFAGNAMLVLCSKFPGSKLEKCGRLFLDLQSWYEQNDVGEFKNKKKKKKKKQKKQKKQNKKSTMCQSVLTRLCPQCSKLTKRLPSSEPVQLHAGHSSLGCPMLQSASCPTRIQRSWPSKWQPGNHQTFKIHFSLPSS